MKAETKVMRAIFGECKDEDLCDSVSGETLRTGETLRDTIFRLLKEISEEYQEHNPAFGEKVTRVFVLRFGFEDGGCRTLREVGEEFGLSGERIRAIEAKALRYLRHPKPSRQLRAFFKPGPVIKIDRTFDQGYVRPLHRGVLLDDEHLERIIEDAIPGECYSPSSGSTLKGIHICIEIDEVKKG